MGNRYNSQAPGRAYALMPPFSEDQLADKVTGSGNSSSTINHTPTTLAAHHLARNPTPTLRVFFLRLQYILAPCVCHLTKKPHRYKVRREGDPWHQQDPCPFTALQSFIFLHDDYCLLTKEENATEKPLQAGVRGFVLSQFGGWAMGVEPTTT